MNIRDMHIEINQNLQQVASNRTRKFLPQEIDWAINKNINRYIQFLIGKSRLGFEDTQINIDSIRPLIVPNINIPLYKYELKPIGTNINKYYTVLPPDYSYLISDSTYVIDKCKYTIIDSEQTYTEVYILQPLSAKTTPPYYQTLSITINGIVFNIPQDLPLDNMYKGYDNKYDISFLTDLILKFFKSQGVNLYWERYGEVFKPNSYIVITDEYISSNYNMIIDGINQKNVTTLTKKRVQSIANNYTNYLSTNLLTKSSDIVFALTTAYYKPSIINPVSQLTNQILFVYSDNTFAPSVVNISYIRRPAVVSLAQSVDCDLAPEFHYTILDKTAEYLRGSLQDPQGFQLSGADINQSVVI